MIHFHTSILKNLKQSASNNQNITQKILLKSFWSCCKLLFFIQTLSSIPLGDFFFLLVSLQTSYHSLVIEFYPFCFQISVTNHRANSRKKVIILCFLQKLRIQEVMLSCLQKLEDLMDFFFLLFSLHDHTSTLVPMLTWDQSSRQEREPACFHMTRLSGFTSPGAAVGSHSCLTSGMEQVSLRRSQVDWDAPRHSTGCAWVIHYSSDSWWNTTMYVEIEQTKNARRAASVDFSPEAILMN